MARRSPARFLAPIALVAFSVALYNVVQDAREPTGGNTGTPAGATASPTAEATKKKSTKRKRKTYTVKSGDTLSGIAEKTNVSLETLRDLNDDVDTLSPGQKLRLSR